MDFLDPKKQKRHKIQLIIGYILLVIVVGLVTLVLVFASQGYGFNKNGQVLQNGFVFVSSTPNPAQIYLNDTPYNGTTNTRMQLPAGQYTLKLQRPGYRTWVRPLGVEGGSVEHFDYPFLFPVNLVTTNMVTFKGQPSLMTQSPSRRWLLVSNPEDINSFLEYDFNNPKQPVSSTLTLPAGLLATASGSQSWQVVQWSTDNQHVLLEHLYHGGSEFILLDRQTPADSVNLTKTLGVKTTDQISLQNEKYNQYYLYDPKTLELDSASLTATTPVKVLSDVLAYKPYGSNVILYATPSTVAGEVNFDVLDGTQNYKVASESAGNDYMVNITQYQGNWYAIFGDGSDGKIYIYENPMTVPPGGLPQVPVYILKISDPDFLQFSANAQFIAAENGDDFAVYDIFNEKGYTYKLDAPLAANETAQWMDGDRLTLVSDGKIIVFDYDNANQQTLQSALPGYGPLFDPNYEWSYTLAPGPNKGEPFALTSTALRLPADQ